jgi:hypothetical protein
VKTLLVFLMVAGVLVCGAGMLRMIVLSWQHYDLTGRGLWVTYPGRCFTDVCLTFVGAGLAGFAFTKFDKTR